MGALGAGLSGRRAGRPRRCAQQRARHRPIRHAVVRAATRIADQHPVRRLRGRECQCRRACRAGGREGRHVLEVVRHGHAGLPLCIEWQTRRGGADDHRRDRRMEIHGRNGVAADLSVVSVESACRTGQLRRGSTLHRRSDNGDANHQGNLVASRDQPRRWRSGADVARKRRGAGGKLFRACNRGGAPPAGKVVRAARVARLKRDQGEPTAARNILAPLYDWFSEGFDTHDLKDAKALLAALAS